MALTTSEQIRAARALLRWDQKDLAERSGVSLPTIKRIETQRGALNSFLRTVEALRNAIERAGVEFTNGGEPGVRMSLSRLRDRNDRLRMALEHQLQKCPPALQIEVAQLASAFGSETEDAAHSAQMVFEKLIQQALIIIDGACWTDKPLSEF